MQLSHASHQQQAALNDWRTIGVIKYRKPIRFTECRHKGFLGTPDERLCANCRLAAKLKERKELA